MLFLRIIKNSLLITTAFLLSGCGNGEYEEVELAKSKEEVIKVYKKYPNLHDENDFIDACVSKLEEYNLTQKEIEEIADVIEIPANINVIVVPDFSNRLTVKDNPEQATRFDIPLICDGVFQGFYDYVAKKAKSPSNRKKIKDRLIFDLTDSKQAGGFFLRYVDNINIDFSSIKKDEPLKKYLDNQRSIFTKEIENIYKEAEQKPLGADYYSYFKDRLYKNVKKTTLKEKWINKVVLITDGYLEPDSITDYTNIYGNPQSKPIPTTGMDFYNCEVYICQINKRVKDKKADINVLKQYWRDWFISMNFKNVSNSNDDWWEPRNESTTSAVASVAKFILGNSSIGNVTRISSVNTPTSQNQDNIQKEKIVDKKKELSASPLKTRSSPTNPKIKPGSQNNSDNKNSNVNCQERYDAIYNQYLRINDSSTKSEIQKVIEECNRFLDGACNNKDAIQTIKNALKDKSNEK